MEGDEKLIEITLNHERLEKLREIAEARNVDISVIEQEVRDQIRSSIDKALADPAAMEAVLAKANRGRVLH